MKVRTVLLGTIVLALLAVGAKAHAQTASRRQVAVALVDTLSQRGLKAEIIRFSDPDKLDVILLPRGQASAGDLAAAIATYRRSAASTPARPGLVARSAITEHSARGSTARELQTRSAAMLSEVRRAPFARIGNYGRGQWRSFEVTIRD